MNKWAGHLFYFSEIYILISSRYFNGIATKEEEEEDGVQCTCFMNYIKQLEYACSF
jgi:hypothetical protein